MMGKKTKKNRSNTQFPTSSGVHYSATNRQYHKSAKAREHTAKSMEIWNDSNTERTRKRKEVWNGQANGNVKWLGNNKEHGNLKWLYSLLTVLLGTTAVCFHVELALYYYSVVAILCHSRKRKGFFVAVWVSQNAWELWQSCTASSSDRFPVRTNARLGAARECSTAVLLLALQKSISGVIGDGPRMHCSGEELTYRKLVRIVLEQQSGRLGATFWFQRSLCVLAVCW